MRHKLTFLFLFLFALACKKKVDESPPVIAIVYPAEDAVFSVYDTIVSLGTAYDDRKLEVIQIKLLDESGFPMLDDMSIQPTSNNMNLIKSIALTNVQIKSAYYSILYASSDGHNRTNTYRRVYIQALPLERSFVYFTSGNAVSGYNVYKIDKTGTVSFSHALEGDFLEASTSNYYQSYYSCCSEKGSAKAFSVEKGATSFTIPALVSANRYFTAALYDNKLWYLAQYDAKIIGRGKSGEAQFNAICNEGYFATQLCRTSLYLVAATEPISLTSTSKILVFNYPSGVAKQELAYASKVVAMFKKDEQTMIIFKNTLPKIQLYRLETNSTFSPKEFTDEIKCVAQIDADTYLIATNAGIFKYQYSISSSVLFIPTASPSKMAFDALNNELLICEGNTLKIFNYASTALKTTIVHTANITDLDILYNREP